MRRYFHFIFLISLIGLFSNKFVLAQTAFPEELSVSYYELAEKDIANEIEFPTEIARSFYEDLYETKRNLFLNNSIYFSGPYNKMVREISKNLLANEASLYEEVNIYVTKFASRNAVSLPDGSIFINIGLIAATENEAQLAFVIAHEIAHYKNQHARKRINRISNLMEEQQNMENVAGNFFRRMKYSREFEFEADGYALALLKSTGYLPQEAIPSLNLLIDSLDFKVSEKNIIDILSSDLFSLDTSSFVYYDAKNRNSGEILKIEDDNDLLLSHPSMNKRTLALKEIMESMKEEYSGGEKYLTSNEEQYSELITQSKKDMIENLFNKSEYISSLTLSLEALASDPDDQFMKVNVIRNLYQLAYYKEIENIDNILEKNTLGNSDIMMEIKGFISEVSFDEIKKLTFGYTKKEVEQLKNDEELLFYHGLITKSYLGKEPARLIFNRYKANYPNGKYLAYIEKAL